MLVQKFHWWGFRLHIELIFKILLFAQFWCSFKEEYLLSENAIKELFPFPTTYLCGARFFSYTSTEA